MLYVSTIILSILDIWNDKFGQTDCLVVITKRKKLLNVHSKD